MGSSESILSQVDANLGHRAGKLKAAREFFSVKQNLRKVWRELDVDRNKYVTQTEMRIFIESKIDIGQNPWRYLGGISEKTMRAAFRKTMDVLNITDGLVPKRGFTVLLKNIWYFSTFWELFEAADLNYDSKLDRLEFGYLCSTYKLKPDALEYDRSLQLTKSDYRFGIGFFAFAEYALYMIRGRRKKDERGMYVPDYRIGYESEEEDEEEEEEEECEGEKGESNGSEEDRGEGEEGDKVPREVHFSSTQ